MNRRNFNSIASLSAFGVFTHLSASAQTNKEPVFIYAYQEGTDPNNHEKHTLFLIGEGEKGTARYTAASFSNGTRYSLATSGSGTYAIEGESITIKAGKLEGTGTHKRGEFVEVGTQKFVFARKM